MHDERFTYVYRNNSQRNNMGIFINEYFIKLAVQKSYGHKRPKYLPKILSINLDYPNLARFLIFETLWAIQKHSMSENNITKINGICVW